MLLWVISIWFLGVVMMCGVCVSLLVLNMMVFVRKGLISWVGIVVMVFELVVDFWMWGESLIVVRFVLFMLCLSVRCVWLFILMSISNWFG